MYSAKMRQRWKPGFVLAFLLPLALPGQPTPLTLQETVDRAKKVYPTIQVSRARADAAAAAIRTARTSYLPRVDTLAQINRATRNNIYGMLLQQPVISPISGPPVLDNSASSVFGSAVGMLVDWEPFDFGLRKSRVDLAEASRRRTEAAVVRSEFEAAAAAADAYLTILAAQATERSAIAGVERSRAFLNAIDALVRAELRPGADSAVSRADLAAAQTQVIRSRQAVAEAKALLGGLTGAQPDEIATYDITLLTLPENQPPQGGTTANPLLLEQGAAVDEAKARLRTLGHQWAPRFSVQGTAYSRGTGARPDFTTLGGANGLAPNYYNWGLGFSVRFPVSDYASIRSQQAEQAANLRAEEGRYKLVETELETRRNQALAGLQAAREIAQLTPSRLEAAKAALAQAQARYQSGLGTIVEVADAQRVLTQAEIDDSLARLAVWRAYLAISVAQGDLAPFLQAAGR